ncbi:Succinate dehydrogenase [ubiquinone] cytochrome b small subunit [Temnothorax longispinosus]|uniref:Succinate dehydrogenase [ubiquinone] cytochrome b small subunit n=1 Tax=Temnothorax longispinosus TaxID=300112 RepID=A0A4S2KRF2_9HYME|nr:Succinate dehydrogenase [ubiquinone] cytochrome b small subunit [Temnothorax longispinosus]
MNFGRVANINVFRKIRQLGMLTKCTLLSYLFQLPAQSTVSMTQTRAASAQGDHVRLWVIERIVSASFLALIPAALIFENKFIDILLAAAIVMHTHWGLEAIVLDYARPIVVGTLVPKVAFLMLNLLSAATLAGLLVLIYNGPGLTKVIKNGWAIGKDRQKAS